MSLHNGELFILEQINYTKNSSSFNQILYNVELLQTSEANQRRFDR